MAPLRLIVFLLFLTCACAQNSIEGTLKKYNRGSIPYISAAELSRGQNLVLLDSRSKQEFDVSHLQNAIWVGYEHFSLNSIRRQLPDKNTPVVVYCSVGVRSEDVGEKLVADGYTDVLNLYGGIFEWKNKGYPVFDNRGRETQKVHAYDKQWGKLLKNGEKVY